MSQFYCRENELTALSKGKCIHLKSWIIQVKYCLWELTMIKTARSISV